MWEFVILGPTALRIRGNPVDLGTAKQRGLLAVLLYNATEPVRADALVEHLWPGRAPQECRENLYTLVSRARAVLHKAGLPNALVRVAGSGTYRLDVEPGLVDFHRFRRVTRRAREAARKGQHSACVALLTEAVVLWRDEPLADLRGAQAEHLRSHMKGALLDAQKSLVASQLQIARYDLALTWLEALIHPNDLDETLAQYWVTALCATNREADARAFLTLFRRRFRKEMHAESSVKIPDAPAERGPTRTSPLTAVPLAARPRQLPNDITDFTGHPDLLIDLDALTGEENAGPNVVVVSGMPGAGKTTLAVHWAHRQRHRFPDGQLYLNAGAYGPSPPVDSVEALGRFLDALGVSPGHIPAGVEQRRDRFNQVLAERQVLIILDNVQDSAQVRPLLPTSDSCVTLITSRNRLRGLTVREGVRNVTVAPLPEDACLQLLRRVVGTARAAGEPEALQILSRLSGGLPLAVRVIGEHVAARPRALIGELVDELTTRLLDCEGEDDDEATLRTVFAWSYNAVGTDAAHLFRMLGLYPGRSISPDVAATLAGTDPHHAEQLLNALARSHLINHDTARRYRFHDLLRRFAADRAERDEPAAGKASASRRLLDWYLLSAVNAAAILAPQQSPVPDLPAPDSIRPQTFASDAEALKWCEVERSNLGAVARWAAEHGFHRHGWQIPGTVHEIFERYGRQDDVLELQEIALWSAQLDEHHIAQIGTLNNLGATHFARHDYRQAAASFEAALELARGIGHLDTQLISSHNLASVYLATGKTAEAAGLYREFLQPWRDLGNPEGEASSLHRLGEAHRLMKQYDEAISYNREALSIRERIGSLRGQGMTHSELAVVYLETGRFDDALQHCRQALVIHDKTKDDVARCDSLTTMADVQRELTMYRDAIHTARQALAIGGEIADTPRRCRALTVLAHTLATAGHGGPAYRACIEALNILDQVVDASATAALRNRLLAIRDSVTRRSAPE